MLQTITFLSEPAKASHLNIPEGITEGLVTGELVEAYLGCLIVRERADSFYSLCLNADTNVWEPVHWDEKIEGVRPAGATKLDAESATGFAEVLANDPALNLGIVRFSTEDLYQAKMHLLDVLKNYSTINPMLNFNMALCLVPAGAAWVPCKFTGVWYKGIDDENTPHYFTQLSDDECLQVSRQLWALELGADNDGE